jgi:hypothetical protein
MLQLKPESKVVNTSAGQVEPKNGHQKDTFGALACRAGVEGKQEPIFALWF